VEFGKALNDIPHEKFQMIGGDRMVGPLRKVASPLRPTTRKRDSFYFLPNWACSSVLLSKPRMYKQQIEKLSLHYYYQNISWIRMNIVLYNERAENKTGYVKLKKETP